MRSDSRILAVALLGCLLVPQAAAAEIDVYLTTHHVVLWAHHSKLVIAYDDEADCVECADVTTLDRCVKDGACGAASPEPLGAASGCEVLCEPSGWFGRLACRAPERQYCTVVGAGAVPLVGPAAKLLGALNRPTGLSDVPTTRTEKIASGADARALVASIVSLVRGHQAEWRCLDGDRDDEKLDYDLIPALLGDHNSNSFIHGLLSAGSHPKPRPPVSVPGWDQPVPETRFAFGGCQP